MKIRRKAEAAETREDVRELAEALSLFGSAMRHAAGRRAVTAPMAEMRPARPTRMRRLWAPALAAAAVVAAGLPAYSHFHSDGTATAEKHAPAVQETNTETRASVSDTVLMNQIDNNLSEDVPDALQPLAQLGELAAAKTTNTEKNNASQK